MVCLGCESAFSPPSKPSTGQSLIPDVSTAEVNGLQARMKETLAKLELNPSVMS